MVPGTVRKKCLAGIILCSLAPRVEPAALAVGATVTFTATVKNQGTEAAGPSEVWAHLDELGDGIPEMTPEVEAVAQLAPGDTTTVRWEATWWQAIAGTHKAEFCADVSQFVTEASETNNCEMISF